MRSDATRMAILAIALASLCLHPGCEPPCPSADRAPVRAGTTATFAVLAIDDTRAQISLLDETGSPITWPVDGRADPTDVWLDANDDWEDMRAARGIGVDARLPWAPLPAALPGGPFVTVLAQYGGREIIRFPTDGRAPLETRTQPALVGVEEGSGGAVVDLAFEESPGGELTTLLALRAPGTSAVTGAFGGDVLVIDLATDPENGGAIVDTIPLAAAGAGAAAGARRMVSGFGRLYVGLDRHQAGTAGTPGATGAGAIAIVDPAGRRLVGTFEIPEPMLARCADVAPVPERSGDPDSFLLAVGCAGAGAELADRQASAAVVLLRVTRDPETPEREPVLTVEETWRATSDFAVLPSRSLVALPGHAIAAVAAGDPAEPRDDLLFVVDLDAEGDAGRVQRVARAPLIEGEISGMGSGAFLPDPAAPGTGLLVWAAGRQGILRRRVRTVPAADGGLDAVICPSDHPACVPAEDDPLAGSIRLCNRLVAQDVRVLAQP